MPFSDRNELADACLTDGRRRTQTAAVEGIELRIETGILGGLDKQRHVRTPVSGNGGLRAGGLDLGDIG